MVFSDSLPTYQSVDGKYIKKSSFFAIVSHSIFQIANSSETQKVFGFLCLNMLYTCVEFLYGYISNSLSLTGSFIKSN